MDTVIETFRGEGRVDKQNGGKGQKAYCVIDLVALEPGEGFVFENKLVGGSIPKQFVPSIEKGVRTAMESGVLAGYPVIDVKATLVDGTFHEVDSSDYAFAEAARLAFRDACSKAPMIIIEPIGRMDITTPNEYIGAVIGDISKRRGVIMDQALNGNQCIISARVPISETFGYMTDLRSITQGRASYYLIPEGYEEVPTSVHQELIQGKL